MRYAISILLLLHGAIHMLGPLNAWGWMDVPPLARRITKPAGLVWLLVAALFTMAGIAQFFGLAWWWMAGLCGAVCSQLLIIRSWSEAKFGTVVNLILLAPMIAGWGTWRFDRTSEVRRMELIGGGGTKTLVVSEQQIAALPDPVRRWMRRAGVVGRPMILTASIRQSGSMKTGPDGRWMSFTASQWFRTGDPGFLWTADVGMFPGVTLLGRDAYASGRGRMLISLWGIVPVVDGAGSAIDQGSLVRYMAEMMWIPSAALDRVVRWEPVDSLTAQVTMTVGSVTAVGAYHFTADGDPIAFDAQRYFDRTAGATLERWHVANDPGGFHTFEGIRIPTRSAVTWKLKSGDFTWLELRINEVQYGPAQANGAYDGPGFP